MGIFNIKHKETKRIEIDFDKINTKIKKIKDKDTAEAMKTMLDAIWILGDSFVKIIDKL